MNEREVATEFHKLFHSSWLQTWANTFWLGVPVEKPPSDLWVYQEIICELRPDVIVETGTRFGGSALFMASVCEMLGHGRVVTIDVEDMASSSTTRPTHDRLTYLSGSSTTRETIDQVRELVDGAPCVIVILDSDHSMTHVTDELRIYRDIVTVGSYLIVEDTQFNGHPILPDFGPGPMEALELFLRSDPEFVPDRTREKFLFSFSPMGFLKRVGPGTHEEHVLRARQAELSARDEAERAQAALEAQLFDLHALRSDLEAARSDLEAAHSDLETARSDLEAAHSDLEAAHSDLETNREQTRNVEARSHELEDQVGMQQAAIGHVETSLSWRLTTPLRKIKRAFRD